MTCGFCWIYFTGISCWFWLCSSIVVASILQEKTLQYLNTWQTHKESIMGSDKQNPGLLETLKMETVRTIFTHTYPYPHEHSRHAVIAVFIGCLFFISSDNMHTLVQKLDSNIKWWSMYGCLLGFFYFFSSPFIGKTIKPSYSNFSRWYVLLIDGSCWSIFSSILTVSEQMDHNFGLGFDNLSFPFQVHRMDIGSCSISSS